MFRHVDVYSISLSVRSWKRYDQLEGMGTLVFMFYHIMCSQKRRAVSLCMLVSDAASAKHALYPTRL